jgi:hypothetical protein
MSKPKNSGSATPTSNSQTFTRSRSRSGASDHRGFRAHGGAWICRFPTPGDGTWQVDELTGKFVVVFAAQPTALSDPAGGTVPPLEIRKDYPK